MSQMDFTIKFDFPTSWRHGRGVAAKTGSILDDLGCKAALLMTDKSLVDLGILRPVTGSLDESDIEYTVCDEVTMEPTVNFFEYLVNRLDLRNFDSVIAVGGGSVIDVSKGLAVIGQFGGSIRDYAGINKVPERLDWKIIAIPTTAGTGSEVSDGAVFIDEAIQSKILVLSLRICPAIALTDPEMTRSMPPKITANSGVDALVHAIESYLSKDANVATESFAIRAIELIREGLKPAYSQGDNIDAREAVQIGSTMAMAAGMNTHMGLCHAMAMPLCALYHMPHGQACGMTLPPVLAFNAEVARKKVVDIFRVMGFINKEAGDDALTIACYQKLEDLLREVGISARLSQFGYQEDQMQTIVEGTMNSVQRGFNPRTPSREDVADIVMRMI